MSRLPTVNLPQRPPHTSSSAAYTTATATYSAAEATPPTDGV